MNNKGFTLVNILIGVSLTATISMGVVNMGQKIAGQKIGLQSTRDEFTLINNVRKLLQNSKTCTASLIGERFQKSDVDNANLEITQATNYDIAGEGREIELWRADPDGNKAHLQFSSTDSAKRFSGSILITSLKLIMNSGTTDCGFNYCPEPGSDTGLVVLVYEKKIGIKLRRTNKEMFYINLELRPFGTSTEIIRCSGGQVSDPNTPVQVQLPALVQVQTTMNGRSNSGSRYRVTCPVGKTPISCGTRKNRESNEDTIGCYIGGNRCYGWKDKSGNSARANLYCYCM